MFGTPSSGALTSLTRTGVPCDRPMHTATLAPTSPDRPRRWIEPLAIACAAAVAFGAVVPDFYMAADDLLATGMMDEVSQGGNAAFLGRIYGVLFQAKGQGHFR